MPTAAPPPDHDPWRDVEGSHISPFCSVKQVDEHPESGG